MAQVEKCSQLQVYPQLKKKPGSTPFNPNTEASRFSQTLDSARNANCRFIYGGSPALISTP